MAQEQGKILIIEDDPDIRTIIKQLLSGENYQVSEAESAEEGLPLLDEDTDLVILDIMLPNMSGLSACEKIRETSNVPVLFLTAKSQESDKLIGLMAGGDDYLPKPFSYAELLGRIKALLRRYRVYRGKEGSAGRKRQKVPGSGSEICPWTQHSTMWRRAERPVPFPILNTGCFVS